MPVLIAEHVEKLWDTWNIRGLIILSFLLQSFLTLFAPLRRQRGGKWVIMIPLWIAYFLADWVATFTIGLILRAEHSDITAFWAPFLLLHLGGPDTITSFSLEDNELWIRHLLGLILQVGSTIYVILQSPPHNKLWLPTLLVLIAGIIKYAERNHAFYLASFDHFGNNWTVVLLKRFILPIPVQFLETDLFPLENAHKHEKASSIISSATCSFGSIKSLLVGPPMTGDEQGTICNLMAQKDSRAILRIIEIQLSLLYELLHSKLPVLDSVIGYVCRIVNFGCILGALVSFSLLKKHYYQLGEFDIWLTYGLLIGALALDLISIMLLISSDWIIIHWYYNKNYDEFNNRPRWSNSIPQLNIFACRFKNKDEEADKKKQKKENKDEEYSNKLIDFLGIRSLFETVRRIQCVSLKKFEENQEENQAWKFIFTTLKEKRINGIDFWRAFGDIDTSFAWTLRKFDQMESLLIWHIATEICYQKGCPDNSPSSSNHINCREICKLISDYMFCLLVMEPTMTAASSNKLKIVFEGTDSDEKWKWPSIKGEKGFGETFIKDLDLEVLLENGHFKHCIDDLDLMRKDVDKLKPPEKVKIDSISRIAAAFHLAKELLNQSGGCPWELVGRYWVKIVCYAANNCQPTVHARQVSRGGQLLTLVWLLLNHLGLTPPSKDWYDVLERRNALELMEPAFHEEKMPEKPAHPLAAFLGLVIDQLPRITSSVKRWVRRVTA